MLNKRDLMNMRDTKFTVTTIYPIDKQKFLMDTLRELAQDENLQGPIIPAMQLFTLDEALNYFKKLKERQDSFDAEREKTDA
jgi:hypothetical protein